MKISNVGQGINFKHKIIMDIGASSPKGTVKIKAESDDGTPLLTMKTFVNSSTGGFENSNDFIDKLSKLIKRVHDRVLIKNLGGEYPLSEEDKLLSGVAVFVPGTTNSSNGLNTKIAFMPNLRDKQNIALKDLDFSDFRNALINQSAETTGFAVNKDKFDMVVTKDLGATGMGLAKILASQNLLNEGDFVMGVMTGGGFGSVDIKVKNNNVEFETSESSSYIAGNYASYDTIADIIEKTIYSQSPKEALSVYRYNNNEKLKKDIQVLGKLGRQGCNVKSHIGSFCAEIGRKDLFPLLQAIGDARIVELNRLSISEKDTNLLEKIRSYKDEFNEIASTSDGKYSFELNEEYFGKETLKRARTVAVNDYANSISLIAINRINDCVNKIYLLGPFVHGVNQYVINHQEDFDGAKDLSELIVNKVKTNIDEKHADLPSTKELMKIYNFQIICDSQINIADNTHSGNLFLNPKCKFIPNRGSWFSIPLDELKK